MRFRFDLLAITVFSFFNNLEEVKFYQHVRQHMLRVVVLYQANIVVLLNSMTISLTHEEANVIGTSE